MPDICTASVSPNNCSHRTLTVAGITFELHEGDVVGAAGFGEERKAGLLRELVCYLGVPLAQLVDRVIRGEEATNVKPYYFFGPGAAITKTNIGTAYLNICPGANGERIAVDLTACTKFRARLHANLVAAGPFQIRIVRDSDNLVLYESPSLTQTGERELDTASDAQADAGGFLTLPQQFVNAGIVQLRAQAKGSNNTDDPVFRSLQFLPR